MDSLEDRAMQTVVKSPGLAFESVLDIGRPYAEIGSTHLICPYDLPIYLDV